MSIKVWIGQKEYENTHENRMAQEAIAILKEIYTPLEETCHILVNFEVPFSGKKKKQKPCSIDFAIVKRTSFIIVEMKDYAYAIDYRETGKWSSYTPTGEIDVKGGKEGRSPFGQVRDYRLHLTNLLKTNWPEFLATSEKAKHFLAMHYVSAMVLCPTRKGIREDQSFIDKHKHLWFSFIRMNQLAETVCSTCGGRDGQLTEPEIERLITKTLKLDPAHLIGNIPKRGRLEAPVKKEIVEKKVIVEKFIEKVVEKPITVITPLPSDYGQAITICESDDSNNAKIFQLGDIFRHRIMHEKKKRFKKTIIHSLGRAAEILLSDKADEKLRYYSVKLFRLLAKLRKEKATQATALDVDESFKTICLLTEKFHPGTIPESIKTRCDNIVHRKSTPYHVTHSDEIRSLRLEIKKMDKTSHTFVGVDHSEDDAIGVEFTIDYSREDSYFVKSYDKILKEGDIISIVTPMKLNKEGDLLKPSEIVLEPDYLLSPQSLGQASVWGDPQKRGISACHFWLNALNIQQKDELKQYILLGNYANLCLENAAHRLEQSPIDILKDVLWPKYSLEITTALSDEKIKNTFVSDSCCNAFKNINALFTETLPKEHGIQNANWQTEAPLYSPTYGLSARADALTYLPNKNYKNTYDAIVLELKSGKWDNFRGVQPKEEHLCQPSFYADILYFALGIPRTNVKTLLYYSKTVEGKPTQKTINGQLFENPSRGKNIGQMIRDFVVLRNSVIAADREIRSGNIQHIFDNLEAEQFKNKTSNDSFWEKYQLPEITHVLQNIQNQTSLSKSYFYRMLKFVADEAYLARVGEPNSTAGRGGLSMLWRVSRSERKAAGMRFSDLKLDSPLEIDKGLVQVLSFDITLDKDNANTSLRQGDAVCLYVDKESANITNSILFGASIEKLTPKQVIVRLDEKQKADFFTNSSMLRYALEPAPINAMKDYASLGAFLRSHERRRKLILNQTPPQSVETPLPCDLQELNKKYPGVDAWITHAWNAQDWYLLWGPPGTGKTSHAMRALVDLAMAKPKTKILLLSYTYRATDEICKMLNTRIEQNGEDYIRIGNANKCDEKLRNHFIENLNISTQIGLRKKIENTRIFVSTVSAFGPSHPLTQLVGHFDLAIVDEASQLLDIHLLPLFCSKTSDSTRALIDKFILIGDDKQLPAVVQQNQALSQIDDEQLRNQGFENCRESLFARFKRIAGTDCRFIGMLDTQFRMHSTIAAFCNHYFYEGKLQNGNLEHQLLNLPKIPKNISEFKRYTLSTRLGFFPVQHIKNGVEDLKISKEEARKCATIIQTLMTYDAKPISGKNPTQARPYKATEITIIVPFRNQISCIKNEIAQLLGDATASEILIDTVERNQGGENDVVIFSTVICNEFQTSWLSDVEDNDDDGDETNTPIDRKLNVAITRAKERFYLVGDEIILNKLDSYYDLLRWIAERDGFQGQPF